MSQVPSLTGKQVETAIPEVSQAQEIGRGGQKIVFRCEINGSFYAIKFIRCPEELEDLSGESDTDQYQPEAEVVTRAKREIETMRDCASEHMVKLGPIGLEFCVIDRQKLAYYTEEFIEGTDLKAILDSKKTLPPGEIVKLGLNICDAIRHLWEIGKVHRDIKPGNIMQRASGGYVLLDAGLAFDVSGDSLSGGFTVGTKKYFSPEQFDYNSRRTSLDFRSDMFSLGVTLYELASGNHPFYKKGNSSETFFNNVTSESPSPISELIEGFPKKLDDVILRMLGKSPHLRYRKCDLLTKGLEEAGASL